jgi:octaprenyl-diphosphate synthase
MAKACNYKGNDHINTAVIIEFIHTATLLHDDVIDSSLIRRGINTVNNNWGNKTSILMGDFLYSRAFQIAITINNTEILNILANTTNILAEGEIFQLYKQFDIEISEEDYFKIINQKTAKLFESSLQIISILSKTSIDIKKNICTYGYNFGIIYQLMDDILDYTASHENYGKKKESDIDEGKVTLPLIYAYKNCNKTEKNIIKNIIQKKENKNKLNKNLIHKGIEYTYEKIKEHEKNAINSINKIPNSKYKEMLLYITEYITNRKF